MASGIQVAAVRVLGALINVGALSAGSGPPSVAGASEGTLSVGTSRGKVTGVVGSRGARILPCTALVDVIANGAVSGVTGVAAAAE